MGRRKPFERAQILEHGQSRSSIPFINSIRRSFSRDVFFEIVTEDVGQVNIPSWVFTDHNLPVERRAFSYQDMLNENEKFVDHWRKGSSIPDISRQETQLWFYYLAASYINIGIEALHLGQVELIGMNDPDRTSWASLLSNIRQYAAKHARRNWIVLDAHVPKGGMIKDGVSLIDFNSFPLRIKASTGKTLRRQSWKRDISMRSTKK